MDGRRRRRRSLIVSSIAVVWSAALLTIVALLYKQGAQKAAEWAGVLGSVTALAAFTEPLVERAVARSSVKKAGGSEVAGLHRAAEQLAGVVRSQWRDEATDPASSGRQPTKTSQTTRTSYSNTGPRRARRQPPVQKPCPVSWPRPWICTNGCPARDW
jgi:hypothetical protein